MNNNERFKLYLDFSTDEGVEEILKLGTVLSNETRVNILRALQSPPFAMTFPELHRKLKVPNSTLLFHLCKLEECGIVCVRYKSSSAGTTRIIQRVLRTAEIVFFKRSEEETAKRYVSDVQAARVGWYSNYANGTALFFVADKMIHNNNYGLTFSPEHFNAELVYAANGVVTYDFSNAVARDHTIKYLELSLEICSEAPYYDNNYLSDITFWINGVELCCYTCKGDYGDRRGNLNPDWWPSSITQYGELLTIIVNEKGVFVNGIGYNHKVNISHLKLSETEKITLKFGNKDTAEHIGGFNVFGSTFGDYPQDIVLKLFY